ncbi:MAG: spondin domain-containing protein [Kofleriaceae bacterium]
MTKLSLLAAVTAATLGACGTDDPMPDATPSPTTFKVRIENIAPWTVIKSGVQATRTSETTGPITPGQSYEIAFTAGKGQRVSFVAMLGQSNDWFFGPGPDGIALYDANGAPRSGDVTSDVMLWDAGTEIDQEPGVGDATGPKQPGPDYGAADTDATVRMIGAQKMLANGQTFALPPIDQMIRATLVPGADRSFVLRIENVSTGTTLQTSAGASGIGISPVVWALHIAPAPFFAVGSADRNEGLEWVAESGRSSNLASSMHARTGWPTPISPGVFAVHRDPEPLYALGLEDLELGLEQLAESGDAMVLAESLDMNATLMGLETNGTFTMPVGADAAGPARPGNAYEYTVTALPGDHLSFATMFGMSNDWFFATRPDGIALFDELGEPMRGDVSGDVALYDAGTEIDQEPAIGADTGPQQAAPTDGRLDPLRLVREVPPSTYGVPATTHLRITLEPQE